MREDNREVYDFYEKCGEIDRLEKGLGKIEGARTKELSVELDAAGFSSEGVYAVEGCIWFCPALQEKWDIPESRERLLRLVRMTEREGSMLGISPHFLALGRKRQK